jgi:hypothetical protein
MRYLWEFPDTGATFVQTDIEPRQFDELFAVGVGAEIADSRQEGRRSRSADPGQCQKELEVRAMRKECKDLIQGHLVLGQGVSESLGQRCARKRIEVVGVCEAKTVLGTVVDGLELCGAPLAAVAATLPPFQEACAAVAQDCCGRRGRLQEPQRRGLGQVFAQRIELREREVESGSQRIAQLTDPFLEGHGSLQHAVSSLALGGACDGQKALALPQQVKDTVRLCFISFPGALLHGLAIVSPRLAVDQTDLLTTAVEPFVEGLPVATRGFHGDQAPLTPGFNQMIPESLFKALETLPGVGKLKFATAYDGLRA